MNIGKQQRRRAVASWLPEAPQQHAEQKHKNCLWDMRNSTVMTNESVSYTNLGFTSQCFSLYY